MDWLGRNQAEVICGERMIRLPLPEGNVLFIYREKLEKTMRLISYMKARKCLRKKCHAFLAYIISTKPEKKKLQDVPIVCEYPEVFPEDLPGLPPPRQVEFKIDLVPGAAPIARSPYRLAPSEMKELMNQLQELLDKGFIRPSVSP